MRKIRDVQAKGIAELGAWIVPSLVRGNKEDKYSITVENGSVFQIDMKVFSRVLSDAQYFKPPNKPQESKDWEAEFHGVAARADFVTCSVIPASGENRLKIRIEAVKLKYRSDRDWRRKSLGYVADL